MIKYNDRFEFEKDKYQWILTEFVDSKDRKTGETKKKAEKSFHGTLRQVMSAICDREAGECESLSELRLMLDTHEWAMVSVAERLTPNH